MPGIFRAPTPFSGPYMGRLTPGAPGTGRRESAIRGIVQNQGQFSSPPPHRGINSTVIRRTPGVITVPDSTPARMARPALSTAPALASTASPVLTSASRNAPLPANNRSDMIVLTADEFQKMKEDAGKYQQMQQQRQKED